MFLSSVCRTIKCSPKGGDLFFIIIIAVNSYSFMFTYFMYRNKSKMTYFIVGPNVLVYFHMKMSKPKIPTHRSTKNVLIIFFINRVYVVYEISFMQN